MTPLTNRKNNGVVNIAKTSDLLEKIIEGVEE